MSGTVVSMARSMLMGAISVAASAAAAEMSLLIGVRKDIWFIKEELETMHAFLLSIEATKNKSMILQVWAKQVRDLAYGIEDCLEEFMVHVGNQSRSQKLLKLKDRYRIASQIRDLKARVGEVSHRNTRYNLIRTDAFNNIDVVNSYMEDIRSHSANNIDEAELVGFLKPKEELINMVDVNSRDGLLKVICVVGMGGLGKTTLVRKAYESKENTVNKFSCCAWVIVSQSFSNIEMLKNMIMQLLGPESLRRCLNELEGKAVQVDDLGGYLREELKDKRYFVVLDDLWTIDAIKWIQHIAFPSTNNKGSRIIVTTRDVGLAKQCTSESLIYHLKHLEIDDATNLLLTKSRKTRLDMENYEEMYTVITKIVKKCGGLPLAILTIGGMLATKKLTEWESIYKQIPSELERNPSLEAMRRIVTLSYDNLPSHLKSCFLYLSIFPEDFEIKRRRIVQRWIAEGFVEVKDGVDIEDIGICYFNELINRSMIQPARVNMEGIIKSCRVHDIMRDVMVSISRDESFVYVAQDNVPSVAHKIFRHVTYHGNSKCQNISMYWSHVRSLTMFGERPLEPSYSVCSPDFRMLRTLDLENAEFEITQRDIKSIGLLRHLRYMKFGFSCGYKLPRSIGKLRYLQALDISDTYIISLPTEISKLQSLRILRCTRQPWLVFDPVEPVFCSCGDYIIFTPLANHVERVLFIAGLHMLFSSCFPGSAGVRVPKGIGDLRELRILEVVDIKRTCREAIKELGKLTQLKKLRVVADGATVKKCKMLSAAIEKLSSLSSLGVDAGYHKQLKWLDYISTPPPLLRTLKLCGSLGEVPGWLRKLENLVKIYFERSYIKEGSNSMEILGAVPNLMLLHLGLRSYDGKKLVFTAGAFPKLRKLSLIGENYQLGLEEVRFEEGTSPHMEKMEFSNCTLESGITGVLHLPKLTEISLDDGGQVANLGVLQGEVDAHPNHPVLLLEVDWSYHDLGEVVQGSNTTSAVAEATVREESSLHPDPAAAASGESSSSQVVPVPMRSDSGQDSEDDFCSCNSDDDDDDDD